MRTPRGEIQYFYYLQVKYLILFTLFDLYLHIRGVVKTLREGKYKIPRYLNTIFCHAAFIQTRQFSVAFLLKKVAC